MAASLGWLPSYPTFNKNGIDLYEEATVSGANSPLRNRTICRRKIKKRKLTICN